MVAFLQDVAGGVPLEPQCFDRMNTSGTCSGHETGKYCHEYPADHGGRGEQGFKDRCPSAYKGESKDAQQSEEQAGHAPAHSHKERFGQYQATQMRGTGATRPVRTGFTGALQHGHGHGVHERYDGGDDSDHAQHGEGSRNGGLDLCTVSGNTGWCLHCDVVDSRGVERKCKLGPHLLRSIGGSDGADGDSRDRGWKKRVGECGFLGVV